MVANEGLLKSSPPGLMTYSEGHLDTSKTFFPVFGGRAGCTLISIPVA